jgi:CHAD domain-containing protein
MAYRLRPARPFTQELRSVATSQLQKAIALLEEQPDGPHEAIHDARKKFKRVRALYRLVGSNAKLFRKTENARIRDMARSLAVVRDAAALVETTTYLTGYASSPEEVTALATAAEALGRRRDHIAAEEHDLPARLNAAVDTCREAIAALAALDLDDRPSRTAKRLEKVWKRQRIRAEVALALTVTTPGDAATLVHGDSEEAFHELRKCGQAYWMHLALLSDAWPSAMRAKQRETKVLVDLLGHEHDLSVLSQLIDENPSVVGNGETAAHLLSAIITRQQALRAEALALAAQVFSDDPAVEAHLVGLLWKTAIRRSAIDQDRQRDEQRPRKAGSTAETGASSSVAMQELPLHD